MSVAAKRGQRKGKERALSLSLSGPLAIPPGIGDFSRNPSLSFPPDLSVAPLIEKASKRETERTGELLNIFVFINLGV